MTTCQVDSDLPWQITWFTTSLYILGIIVAATLSILRNMKSATSRSADDQNLEIANGGSLDTAKTESKQMDVHSVHNEVDLNVAEAQAAAKEAHPEAVDAHHGDQEIKEEDGNGAVLAVQNETISAVETVISMDGANEHDAIEERNDEVEMAVNVFLFGVI